MSGTALRRSAVTVNKKYREYFLPTVLTAMATNIAMIVDSIIAGNLVGQTSLAAISLMSPVTQFYFSVTILFGLGASSVISYAKGKRDEKLANRVFTSVFIVICVLSAVLMATLIPLGGDVCSLFTSDSELHSLLYAYYMPFVIGTPIYLILMCSVHFIRADARPGFASAIVITANAVNLALDFLFMGAFKMGIAGSSIATMVGYAVGFVMMLTHFAAHKSTLHFDFSILKNLGEFFRTLGKMVTIGLSGALGTMLVTVKMLFLNAFIQTVGGSTAMVSYSVCTSSQIFMSMFITGASQTMIPIIGVCLGEKDFDGVRYAFRRAAWVLAVSSVVIALFILAAPEPIIRFFGVTDSAGVADAVTAVRINALTFPGMSFSFLFLYYYMSVQRRAFSTAISVINGIAALIPVTLIMGLPFGINGVWWAQVVTQIVTLIIIFFIQLAVRRRSKNKYKSFYLLDDSESGEVLSLSFKGTGENAAGVSLYLSSFLNKNGIDEKRSNRIAVAVEEMAASCAERMKQKRRTADIDIRIFTDKDEIVISVRDNGDEFDPTQKGDRFEISPLTVVKAISNSVEYSRVLGFNRTVIKL